MRLARLGRPEAIALAGAVLLALGLFLPWYATNPTNPNATIAGTRGSVSGWEVQSVLRWAFLAVAVAPFVLAWIMIREHQLSWPRGELTALVAVLGCILECAGGALRAGTTDRPRKPPGVL